MACRMSSRADVSRSRPGRAGRGSVAWPFSLSRPSSLSHETYPFGSLQVLVRTRHLTPEESMRNHNRAHPLSLDLRHPRWSRGPLLGHRRAECPALTRVPADPGPPGGGEGRGRPGRHERSARSPGSRIATRWSRARRSNQRPSPVHRARQVLKDLRERPASRERPVPRDLPGRQGLVPFDLAPGQSSAPILVAPNTPVYIIAVTTTATDYATGSVTVVNRPGHFLDWSGENRQRQPRPRRP